MQSLQQETWEDRRKQLDPYIWRPKQYVLFLDMNTSGEVQVENSLAIQNMDYILDAISHNYVGETPTLTPHYELRFSSREIYYNTDFASAWLLYGAPYRKGKVLPLVERLHFKAGERLKMECRNRPRTTGGELTFNYDVEIVFEGFERWG